ncbi:STAS/SEC14 domain-containing protein [Desertivirga arenae]|uniref:STAS/SEC14 domain-containing protein n=1 Tax=Desertivirga arenae TaxID=2810309 RepID=UPI001A9768D0|nr:STAS/SEC14 domain-containing protein [Pedobacter sp. SYSU D00823]
MVELLEDFPEHVVAYKASGAISKEEYTEIIMQRVNEVAEEFGMINFIVRLETDMDNYSIGAFFNYVKISFQHFSKWKRMAIVSDERWLRMAYETLSLLVPGVIKTYPLGRFKEAKTWVSGPLET